MHLVAASMITVLVVAVLCLLYGRRGRWTRRFGSQCYRAAGVACLVLLVAVNALDWPGAFLTHFWVDHAIFAATVSALPLIGVGYFIFKIGEKTKLENEQELDRVRDDLVAGAARTGLVDHLVDVDVVVSLLSWDEEEIELRWPSVGRTDRPLRWLREDRRRLEAQADGTPNPMDPRSRDLDVEPVPSHWRLDLVDEALRRIMEGVRDWGPTLAHSEKGEDDLVALAALRGRLMKIHAEMRTQSPALEELQALQALARRLAYRFEGNHALTHTLRPEVLRPTYAGATRAAEPVHV